MSTISPPTTSKGSPTRWPEDEKAAFGYDTRSIDWWDYWINIHIPALRKWTYPLIEGRPLEARPVAQPCSLRPSRKTGKWSKPELTEQRGDIPDRFHRIHRRACGRQPAGATRRFAEPAGPRPRSAGSRRPPVAGPAAASGFPALLRTPADAHADLLRRPDRAALSASPTTTTTA